MPPCLRLNYTTMNTLKEIESYIRKAQTESMNVAAFIAKMMNELSYIKNIAQPIDKETYFRAGDAIEVVKTFDNEGWAETVKIKVTEFCCFDDWGAVSEGSEIAYEIKIMNY